MTGQRLAGEVASLALQVLATFAESDMLGWKIRYQQTRSRLTPLWSAPRTASSGSMPASLFFPKWKRRMSTSFWRPPDAVTERTASGGRRCTAGICHAPVGKHLYHVSRIDASPRSRRPHHALEPEAYHGRRLWRPRPMRRAVSAAVSLEMICDAPMPCGDAINLEAGHWPYYNRRSRSRVLKRLEQKVLMLAEDMPQSVPLS
jgi:hypothetical protein